ncbi:MAG: HAD-IB family phosphatase [Lachnospiraceae bacterium]|nr:HAD-IB family phosphatase [Lachnospiraceae bacterium]
MSNFIFLFDLDSTITKQEILPTVAGKVGMYQSMYTLTENAMSGKVPFQQSFLQRVELLKYMPVSQIRSMVAEIELNQKIIQFIRNNKERCYIVTGNLDIWIEELIENLGMEKNTYSSKALVKNDYIQEVVSVIDKNAVISQIVMPFVAIGDGNNDAEMIDAAEIGIGYGGVREISPSVLACASHIVYREETLVEFLKKLV